MSEEQPRLGSVTMGGKRVESAMASKTGGGFESSVGLESKNGGLGFGYGDWWRRVLSERRSRIVER